MITTETLSVPNQRASSAQKVLHRTKAIQYVDYNDQYPDCTLLTESATVIVEHLTYIITSALYLFTSPLGLIKILHFNQAKGIPASIQIYKCDQYPRLEIIYFAVGLTERIISLPTSRRDLTRGRRAILNQNTNPTIKGFKISSIS